MLEVRAAAAADAPALYRLAAASFARPWSSDALHEELAAPGVRGLIAGEGGRAVGFLLGRAVAGEAEILLLGVLELERRRGVGRMLLEHYLNELRDARTRRVTLEVRESNEPALALYRAAGFLPCGRRPRYYAGGESALLLGAEL
jgi:ribosomal-protein-alanine N-acetyltransferase